MMRFPKILSLPISARVTVEVLGLLGNGWGRLKFKVSGVDPNNGTASLLDIARRHALLMQLGWRPRRTVGMLKSLECLVLLNG
uniref:Uncharacterized protein n=1 Tax=Kalanchoe fedtschenkoi TaxID=63787 RepID=A0A7N0UK15_KALFE